MASLATAQAVPVSVVDAVPNSGAMGGADDKYECRDAFLAAKELAAGTG